jgi:signal transduction histidine kinase
MPDGPDYTALTRGQIALLGRISNGETGLAVLNDIVRLAQSVLAGDGAEFTEYAADHGRIVAASGTCESALGRRVDRDYLATRRATPCTVGDRVVGALRVSHGVGDPAVMELLAAHVGHLYSTRGTIEPAAAPSQSDRDLFVAVTSHELRTPVTVIKGYADTLTNHWDSLGEDGRREAVRVVGARAGELARLVDRLLAATSDDGEMAAGSPPGPFDLVEALRAAAGELPGDLRKRLVLDGLPAELPKAFGDRESLATVLTELSTNADKYSPAETEVTITAEADDATVTFRVADRGVGVKPEHVELAFERYWQGEPDNAGRNPGAGLGLYLVRRIVEGQRGWVSLRPREGGGTVAEVRFPRA